MYPVWPGSISRQAKEKTAQVLWPVVIFYMLVLFNCFFILVSNFSPLQFAVFTVNLLITSMLLGWRISIVMIAIGIYLALKLHHIYNPHYNFDVYLGSPGFITTYMLLLVGATIMLFVKPKQEHLEETEAEVGLLTTKVTDLSETVIHYTERVADQEQEIERLGSTSQKILNNVNHELRLPVGNVMNFAELLNKGLEKYDKAQLKMLSEEVYKNSNRLSSMIMNMLDLATLNSKKLKLDKKIINLGELVEDRINNCRKIYLGDKKINFVVKIHPEIFAALDPNYMRQVVDNLIINAIKFTKEGNIYVNLLKKKDLIEFTIQDNGIGIPKEEIYDIFTPFKMGSNAESKAEGRGVGLALCKAAIEAHDGDISAESIDGIGAKFTFRLKAKIIR
jgi:signal transduction histidine kinase